MSAALVGDTCSSRSLRERLSQVQRTGQVATVRTDDMCTAQRKRVERLCKARDKLIAGGRLSEVAALARIEPRRVQRIMTRYLAMAADGRIAGERAFIKNWKLRERVLRKKPFDPEQKSWRAMTGLFRQLMEDNAELRTALVSALRRKGTQVLLVNKLVGRELRKMLRTLCGLHGVGADDYPLCTKDGGVRALRRWIISDFKPLYARDWIEAEDPKAARALTTPQTVPTMVTDYEPYCDWQLDAVTVDLRTSVEILNLRGDVDFAEIQRFKVLRLIELGQGTNLTYLVVFGREPNAYDLGELLWRALNGWAPPQADALILEDGAGFPVVIIPELQWRAPRRIYLDNALAHLSTVFGLIAEVTLGADLHLGTAASPLERAEIESRFAAAARRFVHQVRGTTGTGPLDPQRRRHASLLPDRLVHANDFDACYYMLLANENRTPNMASFGVPPLERLRRAVVRNAIRAQPVSLGKRLRHTFFPSEKAVVHAGCRRPYINFKRVRYSSVELQKRYDLVDKTVYVCSDPADLRVVILYSERGDELCRAHGEGRWGVIPHDFRMRNMALKNIDRQAYERMPQDAPLEFLFARLQREAPDKPSAALQYAHCLAVLGRHLQGEQLDAQYLVQLLSSGENTLDAAQLCLSAAGTSVGDNAHADEPAKKQPMNLRQEAAAVASAPLKYAPRNAVRLAR